jgi:hypothetical protein
MEASAIPDKLEKRQKVSGQKFDKLTILGSGHLFGLSWVLITVAVT